MAIFALPSILLVFPKSSFSEFPAAVFARAEFILPISITVTTPGLERIANNCSTCTAIEFKSFKYILMILSPPNNPGSISSFSRRAKLATDPEVKSDEVKSMNSA